MATTSRATTSRLPGAGAAALVLVAVLSGCATPPTASRQDGFPVEATRTTVLPGDFPRARVPLISGPIVAAAGDADDGWIVAIVPTRGNGLADATDRLAAAGYLTRAVRPGPALLAGPEYDVHVSSAGGTVVYAVRRR
jgi:hypothetical protein